MGARYCQPNRPQVVTEIGLSESASVASPTGRNVVSAWIWVRRDVVRIVVTTIGADGAKRSWYGDLRSGRDKAETIELPDGTRAVTIERPRRVRVVLGQHRARRVR